MINKVKEIIANIMFLDDSSSIKDSSSLFLDLELNSIDMIDLIFELNNEFNLELKSEDIWPVQKLMENELLYMDGNWTPAGLDKISSALFLTEEQSKAIYPSSTQNDLLAFLTCDYLVKLIEDRKKIK